MKRLHEMLSRILQLEPHEIHDDLTPEAVSTWDSFNALLLVSELERTYKIKFTSAEVTGVRCVGDIKKILKGRGVLIES